MEKLFDFVDRKNSLVAGFTYVISINAVLIIILLLAHYLTNLVGYSTIGFSYLILYVFNLSMVGKHLYVLLGLHFAKSSICRMDIAALFTSLVCGILVACLAVIKFNIFSEVGPNNIALTIIAVFTCMSFSFSTFTYAQSISGMNLTTDKSDVDATTVLIDKKLLNKIRFSIYAFSILSLIASLLIIQ